MTSRHPVLALVFLAIIGAIFFLQTRTATPPPTDANTDIVLEDSDTPPASETATQTPATAPVAEKTESVAPLFTVAEKALRYERAKEISTPDAFINVPDITIENELTKGNVVLVDFWTYSCINCQRTLPYLNAWQEAYGNQGLTIIGVHTPEFEFEKDLENVRTAVKKFGIEYPVVLDNDFSTWHSYHNRYWPRKYLIDVDGFIVYDHIGEGGYAETEKKIQELLAERAARLGKEVDMGVLTSNAVSADAPTETQTRETYFGALRNELIANITRGKTGKQTVAVPDTLLPNLTYLGGTWNIRDEYAESVGETTIELQYHAKIVNLVASSDSPVTITVSQDGAEARDVTVQDATLYELLRNEKPGTHTLKISIPESGLRAFTFTFG